MYRQRLLLRHYLLLQCPECFKMTEQRLHVFSCNIALSNHIVKSHRISYTDFLKIKELVREYQKNVPKISFIEFCFKRGYLF